jgi:protein-S-isoprenylcysteine O-methyltransferase Ste14
MILGYLTGGLLVLVVIPCVLYLLTLLAEIAIKVPALQNDTVRWILIGILLVCGLVFGISSIVYQNIVGAGGPLEISDIEISPKTQNLVTTGPYRYSRNPMLFGTMLIYLSLALTINSLSAVMVVILFILFMLMVVVRKEETRLRKDFGEFYDLYCQRTSRFIPWPPKKTVNSV